MKKEEDKYKIREEAIQRDFLNEDSGMAAIQTEVELDTWSYKDGKELNINLWGNINISDCNNSISLDFQADTQETYDRARRKVKKLLDMIKQFDKELVSKHAIAKRLEKKQKSELKK